MNRASKPPVESISNLNTPLPDRKPPTIPNNETGRHVEAFIKNRVSSGLSRNTVRWYKGILIKFAEKYPKLPMLPEPIEDYIGLVTAGDERRHGVFRTLRAFYTFMKKREQWPVSPFDSIHGPVRSVKTKKPLSLEQIQTLLECQANNDETRLLLYALVDTGCRIGEMVNLYYENIAEDSIKITGKTGERIIPISAKVRNMLTKSGNKGRVFPKAVSTYVRMISRAFKNAGLQGSAHLLRHSFASLWDGSDISLKQIGGWASWAMVEHYSAGRAMDKAKLQHLTHSPIAKLYNHPSELERANHGEKIGVSKSSGDDSIPEGWEPELKQDRYEMLYFWHGLLSNITKELSVMFKEFAHHKTRNTMSSRFIMTNLIELFLDDKDHSEDEVSQLADCVVEKFWESQAILAQQTSSKEYLSAIGYQDMSHIGAECPIDEIKLDPAPVLWKKTK